MQLAAVPDHCRVERIGPIDGDAVALLTGTAGRRPEDPGKAAGVGINADGVCRPLTVRSFASKPDAGEVAPATRSGVAATAAFSNPGSIPAAANRSRRADTLGQEGTAVERLHPISRTSWVLRSLKRTVPDVDTVIPIGSPMRVRIQRVPSPSPVELETGSAPAKV